MNDVKSALEANFVPRPSAFPAGTVTTPNGLAVLSTVAALRLAAQQVLRPLAANILASPGDVKFHAIRRTQPWLTFAMDHVHGSAEWLRSAGFTLSLADDKYRWSPSPASEVDKPEEPLRRALQLLDEVHERAAEAEASAASAAVVAAAPELVSSKRKIAADAEAARHAAELEAVIAAVKRDQQTREAEAREAAAAARAAAQGREEDFAQAAGLVEAARRCIHFTGRLRNSLFEAHDFSLRVMRHGRHFACGGAAFTAGGQQAAEGGTQESCSEDCLEAHWHVVSGNLVYAFVAHLSPDASRVMHVGPELGYQYNGIPHTEHFQKFVHTSLKLTDGNGKLVRMETPNTIAVTCQYCSSPLPHFLR